MSVRKARLEAKLANAVNKMKKFCKVTSTEIVISTSHHGTTPIEFSFEKLKVNWRSVDSQRKEWTKLPPSRKSRSPWRSRELLLLIKLDPSPASPVSPDSPLSSRDTFAARCRCRSRIALENISLWHCLRLYLVARFHDH
jgi:hypothetical protein